VWAWHPVAGSAAAEQPPSARLQCVVAGGAPCDFRALPEESRILAYWLGGSRAEKPDCYKLASPAHFVTEDDPPMFFFHGEEDALVPPSSPTAMAALLKAAGVPSRVYTVAEAGHLGAMRDQGALDEAVKFLKRRLQAERRGGIENCKSKNEN
jgi:dipeptidyl aminopeptidase/acylaminoacyl peptidase